MPTRYACAFTAGALVLGVTLLSADEPENFVIPPRAVTLDLPNSTLGEVAPALSKLAGIPVAFPPAAAKEPCDGVFNAKPFWFALDMVASQTGNRIVLHDGGRKVALEPRGKSYEVSDVHGPFRFAARQVVGRFLLDAGEVLHEVHLDVNWEPRVAVFRIDAQPKVTQAADDRGTKLAVQPSGARTHPTGATHGAIVRLTGLTREAKRIAELKGEFTVTASAKMLAFPFKDLTKGKAAVVLPVQEKVTATLKRVEKDEQTWEFELELAYPPGLPAFESFEELTWAAGNRLRLASPDGAKTFAPDDHELRVQGSKVAAVYRFKEDAARGLVNPAGRGWSLVYETPSPPVEFAVPFELKDIPLP